MRVFILVSCFTAIAVARPEAGFAYSGLSHPQAQQEQQQSGLLQHWGDAEVNQSHVHQQLPEVQSAHSFDDSQLSYGTPAVSKSSTLSSPIVTQDYAVQQPQQQQQQQLHSQFDSYSSVYEGSSGQSSPSDAYSSSGYPYASAEPTIHKHIYFHVPPKDFEEEDEALQPRVHYQVGPKQKHYKIVFIKAPSVPAIRPPIVAPQPQNEEKTLIYVLHKKPEETQDIIIPTAVPTQPSKPEVYFIKYKTKKEGVVKPVYGPPPSIVPRHSEATSGIYSAPASDEMQNQEILSAPISTAQPSAVPEQQATLIAGNQQSGQVLTEIYGAPTGSSPINDVQQQQLQQQHQHQQVLPTVPSNQYLSPEIESVTNVPTGQYGPPSRFLH